MSITLDIFLRHWHFRGPPFSAFAAEEEEGQALTAVFFKQPWFNEELLAAPRSCIVYGERGSGKSANRIELRRIVSSSHAARALVVTITDRDVLPGGAQPVAEYVRTICRLTLRELDAHLQGKLDRLTPDSYDLLWHYWSAYAPECARGRPRPADDSSPLSGLVDSSDGPQYTLRRLHGLIRNLDFASVYVLLDSLDEGLDPGDLTQLAGAVRPLLRNPRLLQTCGFTFAFFLPSEVRGLLNGENDRWIEHLPAHTIAHAADDLKAILDLRLRASSREGPTNDDGYVSSFAQLCVPDGTKESDEARRLERRLLDAAAGSPRRLLRLASRVIRQHCASASSAADPISWASIEAAIAAEALGRAGPAPAPTPPPALTPAPPPPAPTPTGAGLLAFYEDGQVTIGGQPVTRLNRLLYRVMALLWEHRGGIIPYDQFEGVLYGADMDLRGDPKSSREKLIRRLRSRIEAHNPNATASRTYIDVIDGVGYALRNYAPADR